MDEFYQKILYDKISKNFGESKNSSIKDNYIRDAELFYLKKSLESYSESIKVLDIGCGNGHTLEYLHHHFPKHQYYGFDVNKELITIAKKRSSNLHIWEDDITSPRELRENYFDVIITERSMINVLNLKKRSLAFDHLYFTLKNEGHYFMIESFTESWKNMNRARQEFNLLEIPVSAHNKYLNERTIVMMNKKGLEEVRPSLSQHFLSTHFYLSRVLHPHLREHNSPMDNNEFVKFFDQALAPGIGQYSPIQFRAFKKRTNL